MTIRVSQVVTEIVYVPIRHIHVYGVQHPLSAGEEELLPGDRGAWNTDDFAELHAKDIRDGAPKRHTPKPGQADDVIVDDGNKWTRRDQSALRHTQFSENDQDVHPQYTEKDNAELITGAWTIIGNWHFARTTTTGPTYTVDNGAYHVFANTDGNDVQVNLQAGTLGRAIRIMNTGSSGNMVIISPNGSEHLLGENEDFYLFDGESLFIVYDFGDGWY